MRAWREYEEMEKNSPSPFPHFLFISSLSVHFLYQKFVTFCRKMLDTALLSRMSQKNLSHALYEEIILGRIRCEEAPQVVPACHPVHMHAKQTDVE